MFKETNIKVKCYKKYKIKPWQWLPFSPALLSGGRKAQSQKRLVSVKSVKREAGSEDNLEKNREPEGGCPH